MIFQYAGTQKHTQIMVMRPLPPPIWPPLVQFLSCKCTWSCTIGTKRPSRISLSRRVQGCELNISTKSLYYQTMCNLRQDTYLFRAWFMILCQLTFDFYEEIEYCPFHTRLSCIWLICVLLNCYRGERYMILDYKEMMYPCLYFWHSLLQPSWIIHRESGVL